MPNFRQHRIGSPFFAAMLWGAVAGTACGGTPPAIELGGRRELFVDDHLIAEMQDVQLLVHRPVGEEVVADCDAPWEGNGCGYHTVLFDPRESLYRMYYKAWQIPTGVKGAETTCPLTIAYRESRDGIHWERPNLGICEFRGSRDNNIILDRMGNGSECHDFSPFIDGNPAATPDARYKAMGAARETERGVWAYRSADGIHWAPLADRPVFTKGAFDSQNVSFWSPTERRYVLYYRDWTGPNFSGNRMVKRATSSDFIHWKDEGAIAFAEADGGGSQPQFYVSQIKPYFRAPHLLIGFPARYVDHGLTPAIRRLPEWESREQRMASEPRYGTAITDSVFITSRDGRTFRQSNDVFLAPGLRTRHNWSYGDNYVAWHVVETASPRDDSPRELSLFATESYFTGRNSRLRRYSLRIDGFSSIHAKRRPGAFMTKPITFTGERLSLNVATSAAGTVRVAIRHPDGRPIKGYTTEDCDAIVGDALDFSVSWNGSTDVGPLAGQPVILQVSMCEADLYSLVFE